jgi:stage III sporulation protein AG
MKDKTFKKHIPTEKLIEIFKKYKYVFIVLTIGFLILLIPSKDQSEKEESNANEECMTAEFSLEEQEKKLEDFLGNISGAGDVKVILSLAASTEQVVANDKERTSEGDGEGNKESDKSSTVIISTGSGTESAITLKYIYPEYRGAVVAAQGADNAEVRLGITQAVSSLTGLSTDKITVIKMEKGQEEN